MRKTLYLLMIVAIVAVSFTLTCCRIVMADSYTANPDISYLIPTQEWMSLDTYVPIGDTINLRVQLTDADTHHKFDMSTELVYDAITDSSVVMNDSTAGTWTKTVVGPSDNSYFYDFKKTSITPMYDQGLFNISAQDAGNYASDGSKASSSYSKKVIFFGPNGDIQGPDNYCPAASVSYCVPVGPSEKAGQNTLLYWYLTSTSAHEPIVSQDYIGVGTYNNGFSTITMPVKAPGTYKLWVRAEVRNSGQIVRYSPFTNAATKTITINELPLAKSSCSGGNSCGSSDGGTATPDLKSGEVKSIAQLYSMVGPHVRDIPISDMKSCSGTSEIQLMIYQLCNGAKTFHLHVYTSCGEVYCVNPSNFTLIDGQYTATLPNGDKLYTLTLGGDTYDFIWKFPGGGYEKHVVGVGSDYIVETGEEDGSKTIGSNSLITVVVDGNDVIKKLYTYKDNPSGGESPGEHKYVVLNGHVDDYYYVLNGTTISHTNIGRKTDDNTTIVTLERPNELDKVRTIVDDGAGNLVSVEQNGKVTRYTRSTDAQGRKLVVVTTEDASGTLYGRVEYLYDTYTTTVTVKDVQGTLDDQVTTYHYVTDSSGNKRYVFMAEIPRHYASDTARDTTVTKLYVPAGYYTEFGLVSDSANTTYCTVTDTKVLWGAPISVTQTVGPTS